MIQIFYNNGDFDVCQHNNNTNITITYTVYNEPQLNKYFSNGLHKLYNNIK